MFNSKVDDDPVTVFYKQQTLEYVKSYKYLGVDICDDLAMDNYVKNVYKKANYKVHMFSKIRKYITKYAAVMIYKQTIVPYLDYASFLMDSAYQYSLSHLDKIHSRCMRIIENKNRFNRDIDVPALMYSYRIQHIRQRRKVQLLSFMFTESKISDNIKSERPAMTLRSNNKVKFKEKFTRKTSVLNSLLYRGYALWNELSDDIQNIKSLTVFKNRLKDLFYIG